MSAKKDSKRTPNTDVEPQLARPKAAVKDLQPKAADEDVKGGITTRKAGKGQHEY